MSEASVAFSAVLEWLAHADRRTAVALIAGCELDDGDSDQAVPVAALEWPDAGLPVALLREAEKAFRVARASAPEDIAPEDIAPEDAEVGGLRWRLKRALDHTGPGGR